MFWMSEFWLSHPTWSILPIIKKILKLLGIFELQPRRVSWRANNSFISLNLNGPSISTTLRQVWKSLKYIPGDQEYIFETIKIFYASYNAKHCIEGPIPVCLAEDETVVKKYVRWVEKSDILVGFLVRKKNISANHISWW